MTKTHSAFFTKTGTDSILLHTKPALTPIMTYKIVQTGANSQLGGLKNGLFKVGYQVVIED
jgi:hypothetical protein